MKQDKIKLAYTVVNSSKQGGYIGAILVTDIKGFPLEFRYSDPIAPTKIQKVLYGQGLDKYVKTDVILDSLLKVISERIDILIINDDTLLHYAQTPVNKVKIAPTSLDAFPEVGTLSKTKDCEFLIQTSYSTKPIRVQFPDDFDCEGEEFVEIIELLQSAGKFMDLDEPISRVEKTLELICKEEV